MNGVNGLKAQFEKRNSLNIKMNACRMKGVKTALLGGLMVGQTGRWNLGGVETNRHHYLIELMDLNDLIHQFLKFCFPLTP